MQSNRRFTSAPFSDYNLLSVRLPSVGFLPMNDAAVRTFRNARREAIFVLCIWFLALVWTVGYCYLFGYRHAPDSWLVRNGVVEASASGRMPTHLGLPSWVFWGIVVPAGCCSVITLLLGLFGMKDDAMGEEQEGPTS